MQKLSKFRLEEYLATREFNVPYMFGSSDAQSWAMQEIINMADPECKERWDNLMLGYTETTGMPVLREEIAQLYNNIQNDNILCFAGAEEGIYVACNCLLTPEDHAIVITPCYQSLESIPNAICETSQIAITHEQNWQLDLEKIKQAIKTNTKLIIINFPHNPTGTSISHSTQQELIEIAAKNDIWIFSDEVYHFLEIDPKDRLPTIASSYAKGISLNVISKSFGLPGLRIGWLALQDKVMLQKFASMKHYLSICNSAPAEILTLIALRNKETILARNMGIILSNIKLLDDFMTKNQDVFTWIRPKGACIAFPKLMLPISAYDFCEQLRIKQGVVALPNTLYNVKENHLRIGFGRKNMPQALKLFANLLQAL